MEANNEWHWQEFYRHTKRFGKFHEAGYAITPARPLRTIMKNKIVQQ